VSAPGVTRFAVLSHTLPGSPWGQGIVLQRVLGGFSADDYCLLSRQDHRSVADAARRLASGDGAGAQPAHAYAVGESWRQLASGPGLIRAVARMTGVMLRVPLRAARIRRVLRLERPDALVVCSGDLVDLPAGFLAARATGIPLLAYVFDDYANQHYRRAERAVARVFERLVLRRARAIVVPNEFMAAVYAARYAVTPRIVRNAIDDVHFTVEPQAAWPQAAEDVRIVYTGSVYQAQADSLACFTQALGLWSRPERVGLHVYCGETQAGLARFGVPARGYTVHQQVASERVPCLLRKADVLFLPLAFASGIPEVIRTSAPAKLGEYLASGVPLLVHAPPDSFVTWYVRKHDCGVVCDTADPVALLSRLERLLDDPELRRTTTANAVRCARRDFDVETARASFAQALRDCV
jgi:Glycosyltransferase Family 4/Glycosyl transferases group 1